MADAVVMTITDAVVMAESSAVVAKASTKSSAKTCTNTCANTCAKSGTEAADSDAQPGRILRNLTGLIRIALLVRILLIPRCHLTALELGNAQLFKIIFKFIHLVITSVVLWVSVC